MDESSPYSRVMDDEYRACQKSFVESLQSLKGDKPFNCDYLRVLSVNLLVESPSGDRRIYNKGDILCVKSAEIKSNMLADHYCRLSGLPKLDMEGELEAMWDMDKKWKIKIIE